MVTGLGLVTPAGIGVEPTWRRVCAGAPTATLDPQLDGLPIAISCRVPGFDAAALLGGRAARKLDPCARFALVAGRQAVTDACLDPRTWNGARVAVVLGVGGYGAASIDEQSRILHTRSAGQVSPQLLTLSLPNMAAGQLAIDLGATGPCLTISTACASGTCALGIARDLLALGYCDIAVAGGADAMVSPLVMAGFAQMGALSHRAHDPAGACRPFDRDRDGLVAAEGAGVLVLERPEHARERGARVRGQILGFGMSADAHHLAAPSPDGAGLELAMLNALSDAGLAASDIGHVNAHGTSTRRNDLIEARVIERVLGSAPLVTSTKGVTGHMLGAAGAVEAALTLLALEQRLVPPTANLEQLDEAIKLDIPAAATPCDAQLAMSNSAGFGGQNASLVLAAARTQADGRAR